MLPVRPLRSTVVTRFLATMSLSDSRPEPFPRLWIPSGRWFWFPFPALPGLPGSSTVLSLRAVPNHPGRPGGCLLVASPPVTGFITLGRLATSNSVTRPNRVRLRYGSQVCFPGFHQRDCSLPLRFRYMYERAIYMVNSFQFTRSARLSLVFQRRKVCKARKEGMRNAALCGLCCLCVFA
jgi:hypothetical protein